MNVDALSQFTELGDRRRTEGDLDGAIEAYRKARTAAPTSIAAAHNLGVALADQFNWADSAEALRAAIRNGGREPATFLALARTLQNGGLLDEAAEYYQTTIDLAPKDPAAQAEYAQLIWMRTASADAARAPVLTALQRFPDNAALWRVLAWILQYCGDWERSVDAIAEAAAASPEDATHLIALAFACLQTKARDAAEAARDAAITACSREPGNAMAWIALSHACLASGQSPDALRSAERALNLAGDDQMVLATLAAACRATGDPRASMLYDCERLVGRYPLAVPPGWQTLDNYRLDLAAAARKAHRFQTHPFGNSVRHGSQAPHILASQDPALQAFAQAIDPAIRAHLERLRSSPEGPTASRAGAAYRISGAWSVRLAAGGFHSNHVHPDGWLSCVCYLTVPAAISQADQAGWLMFGEPNFKTVPPQPPISQIEPTPGQLVIFPSYFWHGTRAFTGDGERLTIAFDLSPG